MAVRSHLPAVAPRTQPSAAARSGSAAERECYGWVANPRAGSVVSRTAAPMKQLYFTSWEAAGGRQARLRAASVGLPGERLQAAARYAGYDAPPQGSAAPPVRLAWLQTPDAGRLLCHSTGGAGPFFSHLLVDVPTTLDAHQAILTWGSRLWQRHDHGGNAELPDALYLPVSSELGDESLTRFLEHPARRDLFQYLLAALLSTKPECRLFVVAPAEDVALCVYGITRALPPSLLENFTFSTYERDPLACPARLVGTCWGPANGHELPESCYVGYCFAYNAFSGRRSELCTDLPFAAFAVEALAGGRRPALDEFHATWQRLGVKEAAWLDLVFRMARGTGTLTREESEHVLNHPTLGAWVAARPDALGQFLEWALEDHGYATGTFTRAVAALRQKPEVLNKLGQTVQERGLTALREGDLVRAANALEAILPMAAPARAAAVWNDLLTTLTDPEQLAWETRCYLLPRLVRLRPQEPGQASDRAFAPWLRVPPERLGELLALHLPQAYQLDAVMEALGRDGEPGPALAAVLAAHPPLVLGAMDALGARPEGEEKAVALFRAVLEAAPRHDWVADLVRHGRSLPGGLFDRGLGVAQQAGRAHALALVREHGPLLVELLAGKPSLAEAARQLLAQPNHEVLADRAAEEFLRKVGDGTGLDAEIKVRLDAFLTITEFLRRPTLERESLSRAAAALALQPPLFPNATTARVLDGVSGQLQGRAGFRDVQADLETVLLTFGPQSAGGPTGLFRDLLHRQQQNKAFWKQPELQHAFLAVALGAPQAAEVGGKLENLDAEAFALAQRIGQGGGEKVLSAIDRLTESWPRGPHSQWVFLAKAVQPRGTAARARDGALFAGGVAAGVIGMLLLRWLGW